MYRFAAAFAGCIVLAGPVLAERSQHEALVTLDQFMIARSVEAKCGKADAVTSAAFQHQYRLVTEQAAVVLKTLSSDLTGDHIEKVMSDHYSEIDRHVAGVVAQESCNGSYIKEALRRYDSASTISDAQFLAKTED